MYRVSQVYRMIRVIDETGGCAQMSWHLTHNWEKPRKVPLGDRLMKAVRIFIASNKVHYLEIMPVRSQNKSERGRMEKKKIWGRWHTLLLCFNTIIMYLEYITAWSVEFMHMYISIIQIKVTKIHFTSLEIIDQGSIKIVFKTLIESW